MTLVRAWLAAIVVYVAGEVVLGVAALTVRPALRGDPSALIWWGTLPTLVLFAAVAAVAAWAHRRPGPYHLAAVLPVPLAALAGSTVLSLAGGPVDVAGVVAGLIAGAAGTAAGWQAVDRLRPHRTAGGYGV